VRNAVLIFVAIAAVGVNARPRSAARDPQASGRIENLETAADLITYNQNNHVGFSIHCGVRCSNLFRHELGHAIGVFGHVDGGALMAAPQVGNDASPREVNMLVQLYKLPHGTRIEPDGSWRVIR